MDLEHVPPKIRKLVCETCWRALFSPDSFQKAWMAQFAPPRDGLAAFSYSPEVLTWTQKQRRQLLNPRHRNHGYDSAIYTTEDDPAARYIPGRDILSDVNSTLAYDLIKKRISGCSLHEHCAPVQRGRSPTRVIDCSDPGRPRLFISNGAVEYYVALSYVWGEKQPHHTTTKNLELYIQGIPLKRIPKTIMDAITVTRKLGFHYLWVDSFCMIRRMTRRKKSHGYDTFFMTPTLLSLQPALASERLLPFCCPDGNVGTMRLVTGHRRLPFSEPVDNRAWCLEERVLSPGRLIYAKHTLLYECHTVHDNVNGAPNFISLRATEEIPRIPNYISTPASAIPDDNPKTGEAWYNIVTLYTQRNLTKSRDRLVAISGIAEHFQLFWPQSRYFTGLWEHQLPGSLLWHIPHINDSCRRPDVYRAPSWSWASIDGICDNQVRTDVLCTIIHCDVTPARLDNPFGEVVGGYLILEAIVQPAVWVVGVEGPGIFFNVACGPTDLPQWTERWEYNPRGVGCVERDAIEPVSEGIGNVYLALVCNNSECVYGLVLVPAINQTTNTEQNGDPGYPVFRRVGWFSADLREPIVIAWLNGRSQCINII
ncbi:hypothetical protein ARMGADRAFT_1029585 [Armillaria gallica]|uniref:Heterokaryon incompatibility domain-containing protein n=1 Tax=Armillaria gallica TaxID=47427 RepID=A0A2H3DH13_ARMGA|nr:hypothetical protein ARMGADRAFT_1029585 [Armillaria gallica]